MSIFTRLSADRRTAFLAWSLSLGVHTTVGIILLLNINLLAAIKPGAAEASEHTTAEGRASRLDDARAKIEKLVRVQTALEKLKQQKQTEYRADAQRQTENALPQSQQSAQEAVQAQRAATFAQQTATDALRAAHMAPALKDGVTPLRELAKASIAMQQAKDAQAQAAVAQEQLKKKAALVPMPEAVKNTLKAAEQKQEAARTAQQKAEEELRKARQAVSKPPAEPKEAHSEDKTSAAAKPTPGTKPVSPKPLTREEIAKKALQQAEMATRLAAKTQADARAAQERVKAELARIEQETSPAAKKPPPAASNPPQGANVPKPSPTASPAANGRPGANPSPSPSTNAPQAVAAPQPHLPSLPGNPLKPGSPATQGSPGPSDSKSPTEKPTAQASPAPSGSKSEGSKPETAGSPAPSGNTPPRDNPAAKGSPAAGASPQGSPQQSGSPDTPATPVPQKPAPSAQATPPAGARRASATPQGRPRPSSGAPRPSGAPTASRRPVAASQAAHTAQRAAAPGPPGQPSTRPNRSGQQSAAPPGPQGTRSSSATSSVRDLATAYQTAQNVQQQITQTYRDVRATQLATMEGISLEEARKRTDTVQFKPAPLKLGPDAGLSTERAAQREMATMVARAERLLDQAQQRPGGGAAALIARMRQSAGENAGRTADMTPFMAVDKSSSGKERGRMPGDPEYLPPPPAPAIPPDLVKRVAFGRRIASGGATDNDWMFVDTWYTIGPFPNPGRQNIDKPFPPEAAVDLDAEYPGKDGRTVRWEFVQSSHPDIVPAHPEEYGIYYAYTELWFDQPRDLWVAVGSDDKSTLWIEDQLVWMSSDQLKGWQIGEGLRFVHFKQGRNRILLRCENGWRGVAFSMTLALKSPPNAVQGPAVQQRK